MAVSWKNQYNGPCDRFLICSAAIVVLFGRLGIWAVTATCSRARDGLGEAAYAISALARQANEQWKNYFAKRDVRVVAVPQGRAPDLLGFKVVRFRRGDEDQITILAIHPPVVVDGPNFETIPDDSLKPLIAEFIPDPKALFAI